MNEDEIRQLEKYLTLKIEALEKVINTRLDAQSEALRIQAAEYERRLENLNNENARINKAAAASVLRELYDSQSATVDRRINNLELGQVTIETKASQKDLNKTNTTTAISVIIAVIGAIMGLVGVILRVTGR